MKASHAASRYVLNLLLPLDKYLKSFSAPFLVSFEMLFAAWCSVYEISASEVDWPWGQIVNMLLTKQ